MKVYFITFLFFVAQTYNCTTWAVLAAGSKAFVNYRHQSDICHAYKSLIQRGIDSKNIILLSYNDAVQNKENPIKGKLFNSEQGSDVYSGCKIDYQGDEVTPENYLRVLTGNKKALEGVGTGRVLESEEKDHVFVYFVGHGGKGFLAFPHKGQKLFADDLNSTFEKMKTKKMYEELVFYLDACQSGSMFQNLDPKLGVYSVTAAKPGEPSYATNCFSVIAGQIFFTCLADEFSFAFNEDIQNKHKSSVLISQFDRLKGSTM